MERRVEGERLRFVALPLEGAGMSEVCRFFGISGKTGDKIHNGTVRNLVRGAC